MSTRRGKPAPIWTQAAPGTRKPRWSRAQIAEVALRVADAEGFEALSMRRIADELGAGTMTLYHYIRTKNDLVALMDDAIMGEILIPPGQLPRDWREALLAIARSSFAAFVRHPWALQALRGARGGPNGMRHVEQSLEAVADAPFDLQGKIDVLGMVDDYVFGHVLRLIEEEHEPQGGKHVKEMLEFSAAMLATGEFPRLTAILGHGDPIAAWGRMAKLMEPRHRFERGLHALLDGMEASAKTKASARTRRARLP